MDRRKFIKAAALGGAGTALAAPMVNAQNAKTITIVSTWPRDFPGLGLSAQRLAERINVVSGGALRTEYTPPPAGAMPPLYEFVEVDGEERRLVSGEVRAVRPAGAGEA